MKFSWFHHNSIRDKKKIKLKVMEGRKGHNSVLLFYL